MDETTLRDITAGDKDALDRFHRSLSPQTQYRRYHGAKSHLTQGDLRYLTEIDGHDHVAVVAQGRDGELLGVARAVRLQPGGDEAEVAIVVRDDLQHAGLGHDLVGAVRDRAEDAGVRRLVAEVQADNHSALRFFQGLGARQRRGSGTVCSLEIPVG